MIEGWDFSDSVASFPKDQIMNHVKFPKIEPGATAWLDVPGAHFVLIDERTELKDSWHNRGDLLIDDQLMKVGYHELEAKFSEWGHDKKRFEFFIRDVDKDGKITDTNLKINDNGTKVSSTGILRIKFACPDGKTVYTKARFDLGSKEADSGFRKHDDWQEKGREKIASWLTIEWSISNKK